MSWLSLEHVNEMIGGKLRGESVELSGVITDTRNPDPNALFIALPGPNFDPHDLLDDASEAVAAALVVSRKVKSPLPQIVVDDTYRALSRLAGAWRQSFHGPMVALTGSNGKTTVKEMLRCILETQGKVLATEGNLNNHIGVPLTLLGLREDHEYAVVEMGANKPGDIRELTTLVKPDVALITNVAPAHVKGFRNLDGVAAGKGEIFEGLHPLGLAVINADDAYADYWQWSTRSFRVMTFGQSSSACIRLRSLDPLVIAINDQEMTLDLAVPGVHNAMNAAAAAAVSLGIGVSPDAIAEGLSRMRAVPGRLQIVGDINGAKIIDDSYNANPSSMRAAIDVLAACEGRRILVIGDMAELGGEAEAFHREVGLAAAEAGIEALVSVGRLAAMAAREFGAGATACETHDEAAEALYRMLGADTTVLVKGSRSAAMETVIQSLEKNCDAVTAREDDHAA